MRYTRISADCHIDMPWLAPDLFTANASAIMKDRMPYVEERADGFYWTGIRRPGDPHLRVKDMDRDGVQAEVLFGILGAATRLGDHEAAGEMFRISSKYIQEQFGHLPPDVVHKITCENARKFYGLIG